MTQMQFGTLLRHAGNLNLNSLKGKNMYFKDFIKSALKLACI